jgi:hypothetical protein
MVDVVVQEISRRGQLRAQRAQAVPEDTSIIAVGAATGPVQSHLYRQRVRGRNRLRLQFIATALTLRGTRQVRHICVTYEYDGTTASKTDNKDVAILMLGMTNGNGTGTRIGGKIDSGRLSVQSL